MPNTTKDETKGRRPDDTHLAQKKTLESQEAEEMRQQIQGRMPVAEEEVGVITGNRPPTTASSVPPPVPLPNDPAMLGSAIPDAATAKALAAMRQELDDTRAEIAQLSTATRKNTKIQGSGDDESYPWQVYRRPDEYVAGEANQAGWLVIAPGGATRAGRRDGGSFLKYTELKGFKPITKYGPADVPTQGKPGHEFFSMLERGGAIEFPVSQVIAYKWHLKPPIQGLVFPQVAEAIERGEVKRFHCDECTLELWFVTEDSYTLQACFTHLTKPMAQGGLHAYRREEAARALQAQKLPAVGRLAIVAAEEEREEKAAPAEELDSRPSIG